MRISDWSSDVCSSDLVRIYYRAVPQDVIDGDQAAAAQQLQRRFVVGVVVGLVGVDEDEVEAAGRALRQQDVQGVPRRRAPQVDLLRPAGFPPGAPGA